MKKWLTNTFDFSKREYNGLLFLLLLTFLISIAPYLYEYYKKENPINEEETAILQELAVIDRYQRKKYYGNIQNEAEASTKRKIIYQPFNPNLATEKEWQQLGLSPKQAQSIVNYIKKGGRFYRPEDLKKMYVISPKKYEELLPYVVIEKKEQKKDGFSTSPYVKKAPVLVNINMADTIQLTDIRGIGPAFARRIARYRERLGGFYNKEQLLEVYGIDTLKFMQIKDQIVLNPSDIKKINVNTADFEDFKRHPYLNFKQMNAIIQYRKQHGDYKNSADLNKILILTPEIIQKIAPYLDF